MDPRWLGNHRKKAPLLIAIRRNGLQQTAPGRLLYLPKGVVMVLLCLFVIEMREDGNRNQWLTAEERKSKSGDGLETRLERSRCCWLSFGDSGGSGYRKTCLGYDWLCVVAMEDLLEV